jgi:hypothetical protein
MFNHLYKKKKQCPKVRQDGVELTDDMRDYILQNRVFIQSVETVKPDNVYQTINVYNQFNSIINSMRPLDGLNAYLTHTKTEPLSLENKVDDMYAFRGQALKDDHDRANRMDFSLGREDMYDIIDSISKMNNPNCNDMALMYDEKLKKLHIREGDAWQLTRFDQGIKTLIGAVQSTYLDHYECYLIRRIVTHPSMQKRQETEELLRFYYAFIESFDLAPYASIESRDSDFIPDGNDMSCELGARFEALFQRERASLRKMQRDKFVKDVKEIVIRNSQQNRDEISRRLLDLVKADDEFKMMLLDCIRV